MGSYEKNIIWMETNSKSKKDCFGYGYPAKNKFVTEKNDRDFKQTQFSFFVKYANQLCDGVTVVLVSAMSF